MKSHPKRIMIVNANLRVGGIERKIADLVGYWNNLPSPPQIDIVLEEGRSPVASDNIFLERVQQSRARVHVKPAGHWFPFSLFLFWQIWRARPQVILVYGLRPAMLALAIRVVLGRRSTRILIGNDTVMMHYLKLYPGKRFKAVIRSALMRFWYPRADWILVPSDASRLDLIENLGVPARKIRVIKNWVRLVPSSTGTRTFDLIYVGRLDPVKQLARFLDLVRTIKQKRPGLRVLIVGDGIEMEQIRGAARALALLDTIEFVGFQSDPARFYAQAKILCLTSSVEGMPMAGLEAMAHGLPIVTLAYPGADELVKQGVTGYICRSQDEFCKVVLELLGDENLRAELGRHARVCVEQEHSERVMGEYVQSISACK